MGKKLLILYLIIVVFSFVIGFLSGILSLTKYTTKSYEEPTQSTVTSTPKVELKHEEIVIPPTFDLDVGE